jgi:hypothetical protein
MRARFTAKVWVWPGDKAAWRFVTVPKVESEKLRKTIQLKRGFGSIRVSAKIGKTSWDTSIFPDSQSGTYLLPVKAPVRRAEGLDDGDPVDVRIDTR